MNESFLLIAFTSLFIGSFFIYRFSEKVKFPAVLLLIALGVLVKLSVDFFAIKIESELIQSVLHIACDVGLTILLLRSSFHLKMEKDKMGLIKKSFLISLVGIGVTSVAIGAFLMYIFPSASWHVAALFALAFAVLNDTAQPILSERFTKSKSDFLQYEQGFSQIIGIIVFYFLMGADGMIDKTSQAWDVVATAFLSIGLALLLSYFLVWLLLHIQTKFRTLLTIAVLALLFAIGENLALSSLLMVVTFAFVLNHTTFFFRGPLKRVFRKKKTKLIVAQFRNLTSELTLLTNTFFFIAFGFGLALASIFHIEILVNSAVIVAIIYAVRYLSLRFLAREYLFPSLFIAPKGLSTLVLIYVLMSLSSVKLTSFDLGLVFYPILISMIMIAVSKFFSNRKKVVTNEVIE